MAMNRMDEPDQDDRIAVADDEHSQRPPDPKRRRLTPLTTISSLLATPTKSYSKPTSPSLLPLAQQISLPDDDKKTIKHPSAPPSEGYNHSKVVEKLRPSSINDS